MSDSLFQALQRNDKLTFLQILKEYQQSPPDLSTDNLRWADLFVTIVSNSQYKEYLELLLEYGDGNFFDKDDLIQNGKTALHFACENGCDENVLVLLQRGSNPNKTTKNKETALHIAYFKKHFKIVEYLVNYDANIDVRNKNGYTPLHLAVISGQIEMIRFFLERKADTTLSDFNNCLPLRFVSGHSWFSTLARLLMEHDLTTSIFQNNTNCSPLIDAIDRHNSIELVHSLLKGGAKIEFCNSVGETPLHYAIRNKNKEILSLLLQLVDIKWIEKFVSNPSAIFPGICLPNFKSLLQLAIHSHDTEILSILLNSRLPKSILQIPILMEQELNGMPAAIHTPLTYLIEFFFDPISIEEKSNTFLHLLLKHKITMLDEYNTLTKMNWKLFFEYTRSIRLSYPFLPLVNKPSLSSQQLSILNLLAENDISSDYCLQLYHDNTKSFTSFDAYLPYYAPVIEAIKQSNLEALKLMMSNSAILEPDQLLVNHLLPGYLFIASYSPIRGDMENRPTVNRKNLYHIYKYLLSLKPLYYKQIWHPTSKFISSRLAGFDIAAIWKEILQEQPSSSSANDEFANVTLKQLCRTTIRQQLREPTLNDNLRNFRRNILALPLPDSLKDYLLFKY